jgi:hypothetical protein
MGLFSTIAFATRGRIVPSGSVGTIGLATVGWILPQNGPQPPKRSGIPPRRDSDEGGRYHEFLLKDDEEIFEILKMWVKWH